MRVCLAQPELHGRVAQPELHSMRCGMRACVCGSAVASRPVARACAEGAPGEGMHLLVRAYMTWFLLSDTHRDCCGERPTQPWCARHGVSQVDGDVR